MSTGINIETIKYSPSSIVQLFSNALVIDATKRIIQAKGIYVAGRGNNYNGFYYDALKDETSDASITLIVPAIIRTGLTHGQTIEAYVFLTKKVQLTGARIELQLNVVELISQAESKFTDDQIKAFELLQRKAAVGYRDVDSFIKTRIIQQKPITVTILIGKTGIIDSDIKHQLKESIAFYDFRFDRISLTSESEITNAMSAYNESTNILVISRGGGENMEVFNKSSLAEAAISLTCLFVTAIGHKENISLLQQVADKSFITPTAFGQYLNDIYNNTVEELQNSKAQLIDSITKQLQVNYEKQIQNFEEKLKATEDINLKQVNIYKSQIESLTNQYQNQIKELQKVSEQKTDLSLIQIRDLESKLSQVKRSNLLNWVFIILAIVLGILIGRGCG